MDKELLDLLGEDRNKEMPVRKRIIAIFGDSKQAGIDKLGQIIKNIPSNEIAFEIQNANRHEVILNNGDAYIILRANACRGYKFHKAYVHKTIDPELVHYEIKPGLLIDDLEYFE